MIGVGTLLVLAMVFATNGVQGFPIAHNTILVSVSSEKQSWREANKTCGDLNKQRLASVHRADIKSEIQEHIDETFWVDMHGKTERCSYVYYKGGLIYLTHVKDDEDCELERYFLCMSTTPTDFSLMIYIGVGCFVVSQMIFITICIVKLKARKDTSEYEKMDMNEKQKKPREKSEKKQKQKIQKIPKEKTIKKQKEETVKKKSKDKRKSEKTTLSVIEGTTLNPIENPNVIEVSDQGQAKPIEVTANVETDTCLPEQGNESKDADTTKPSDDPTTLQVEPLVIGEETPTQKETEETEVSTKAEDPKEAGDVDIKDDFPDPPAFFDGDSSFLGDAFGFENNPVETLTGSFQTFKADPTEIKIPTPGVADFVVSEDNNNVNMLSLTSPPMEKDGGDSIPFVDDPPSTLPGMLTALTYAEHSLFQGRAVSGQAAAAADDGDDGFAKQPDGDEGKSAHQDQLASVLSQMQRLNPVKEEDVETSDSNNIHV